MAEMSEGIAIENDSHYPPQGVLSFPTISSAARATRALGKFSGIIQNVNGDTQSERSERVLNSAILIENASASVAHVTEC